jgi:hypothetical protein
MLLNPFNESSINKKNHIRKEKNDTIIVLMNTGIKNLAKCWQKIQHHNENIMHHD